MYSNLFVCLFGMATVFVGLACIIVLVEALGRICRSTDKQPAAASPVSVPAAPADKAQLIAAISVAIAEEMGTDVSGIRIVSMKKI